MTEKPLLVWICFRVLFHVCQWRNFKLRAPLDMFEGSPALPRTSGGLRVSGARGHRSFWHLSNRVCGKAPTPAANDFCDFGGIETLLMTSKMFIVLHT